MPIQFSTVPLSQIKKVPSTKKGRPAGSSTNSPALQRKRATVTVAAYGAKLFEPVMSRERPISIHFLEYILQDSETITRFSEDGFFAIKFFLRERRCYLIYFINPINPTKETTVESACQEAIDFQIFEFHDEKEYIVATNSKTKDGLYSHPDNVTRLRKLSALGQTEEKIISILRDKIAAEKFLKRQKEYEQQDKDWKNEFAKIEQEKEDSLGTSIIEGAVIEQAIQTETASLNAVILEEEIPKIIEVLPTIETKKFTWGKK